VKTVAEEKEVRQEVEDVSDLEFGIDANGKLDWRIVTRITESKSGIFEGNAFGIFGYRQSSKFG
jgi:hypothetical protein